MMIFFKLKEDLFFTQPNWGEEEATAKARGAWPWGFSAGAREGLVGRLWFWSPVLPFFCSAALVSVSFLLRVLSVPGGRDEQSVKEGGK